MADSHPENTDSLSRMDPHAEFDPLFRLERNRTSTHNAISYAVAVPAITFLVAFVIAMISRTFEVLFPAIPGAVALGGTLLGAWITYRVWAHYGRWRPWLAILWVLVPFTLLWMTSFGTMLIIGHR